jgi:DNA-binding transcriptional LysR family regulator
MRGIGWALIPEHIANDEWTTGKIIELSSKHIPHSLLVEMGIVKRRDKGKGPIMTWMYSEIERMFAEH